MQPVTCIPRIAVVEDDEEMRALVTSTLLREGYATNSDRNGLEFLEELVDGPSQLRIALLIRDIRMPGISGLSLLEDLRELAETQRLKVILITGFGSVETHAHAHGFGAADVIDKPFEMVTLLTAVSVALVSGG